MNEYNKENVFYKIWQGALPCDLVAENEFALAFNDLAPKAKVHVLVIPKGNFVAFDDFITVANVGQIVGFYSLVRHVIIVKNLTETGFKLISRRGCDGGQEIPHFHVHVLGGERVVDVP
ncbi:MAG: HIT domain-containing protein [Holosporales bacterium]|jgi:diadenosine tetraphosphate (Ap4A) HIT family hydrolase|nr:HIT domain-containing protein [Holosporales bacterium]